MLKYRFLISALSGLLLTAGVIAGAFFNYASEFEGNRYLFYGLLGAFSALYVAEFFLLRHLPGSLVLYLPLQTAIVGGLLLLPPLLDTFAILFIAILLQVTPVLRPRISVLWVAIFATTAGITFLLDEGFPAALGQIFVYSASYLLVAGFNINLLQLEATKSQLQSYVTQVEELTVIEERNRLARELHDSVTQIIFGMTFTAETARAKLAIKPEEIPPLLDQLVEQANRALSEMRALIFELRPVQMKQNGLVDSLQEHTSILERQHGFVVSLNVQGQERLGAMQAHHIFRVIQEALNNVIKHAGVAKATVNVIFGKNQLDLTVSDSGRGFAPEMHTNREHHIGMQSMRERVEFLQGVLEIDSELGQGTNVHVTIPLNGDRSNG